MHKLSDQTQKLLNVFERAIANEVAADERDASVAHIRKLGQELRSAREALHQHLAMLEHAYHTVVPRGG